MTERERIVLRRYREIQLCRILCSRAPAAPAGWVWTGSHRTPPLPFYGLKAEPGTCRICWQPIWAGGQHQEHGERSRRMTWHTCCSSAYLFWRDPGVMLVGRRQQYRCAECRERAGNASGEYWGDVEVDHTIPLYRVRRDHAHEPWHQLLRFWSPENLKVLCAGCHKQKCAREANERSQFVKQLDQPLLL